MALKKVVHIIGEKNGTEKKVYRKMLFCLITPANGF